MPRAALGWAVAVAVGTLSGVGATSGAEGTAGVGAEEVSEDVEGGARVSRAVTVAAA
jgi:hypothetical protein